MVIPAIDVSVQPTSSKQPSSLSTYMQKKVGERGQPCLAPISKDFLKYIEQQNRLDIIMAFLGNDNECNVVLYG